MHPSAGVPAAVMFVQGGLPLVLLCHCMVDAGPPVVVENEVARPKQTDALTGSVAVARALTVRIAEALVVTQPPTVVVRTALY